MKRYIKVVAGLLAALLVAAMPIPALAQSYYWVGVEDETGRPYTDDGSVGTIRCSAYLPNSGGQGADNVYLGAEATPGTTTYNGGNTHAGQLVSDANGRIHFYSTAAAGTRYMMKCFSVYGGFGFINDLTRATHRLVVPTNNVKKITRIPFTGGDGVGASSASQPVRTGVFLPQGALVTGVALEIVTPGIDGAHLNVGFFDGLGTAIHGNGGRVALAAQVEVSNGVGRRFLYVHQSGGTNGLVGAVDLTKSSAVNASHIGLFLRHVTLASNAAFDVVLRPGLIHQASGFELTYDQAARGQAGGHIYIFWEQMHMGINRQPNQVRQ